MAHRVFAVGIPLVAGFLLVGCNSEAPTGVVRGVVTLDGNRLERGAVSFSTPDGKQRATGAITDGVYEVKNAPVGKCNVGVSWVAKASTEVVGDPDNNKETPVTIPPNYAEGTSQLTFDVRKGSNQDFNIEMNSEVKPEVKPEVKFK